MVNDIFHPLVSSLSLHILDSFLHVLVPPTRDAGGGGEEEAQGECLPRLQAFNTMKHHLILIAPPARPPISYMHFRNCNVF